MSESNKTTVSRFCSGNQDAHEAISDARRQITISDPALVALFVSPNYDRDAIASAIELEFGTTLVVGCTTSGEITPTGCSENGISGFALSKDDFSVATACIESIDEFEYRDGNETATSLRRELESREAGVDGSNTFAFLIVDGMSRREEPLTASIHPALGDIQLFGGSAGDGGRFQATWVYFGGCFREQRAVLSLIRTSHRFQVFRTQHFVATGTRMVVTDSDPSNRVVRGIDGETADIAYARHLGLSAGDLTAEVFACHPVVVKMGGENFVRSIMRRLDDGSLEFACAIDQGVVLRLARGADMVENLAQSMASLRERIGEPELIIGCDCLFRRVEALAFGIGADIDRILSQNNVIGFTSYGEQFNAVHVNQTLTGVAIGTRRAA